MNVIYSIISLIFFVQAIALIVIDVKMSTIFLAFIACAGFSCAASLFRIRDLLKEQKDG